MLHAVTNYFHERRQGITRVTGYVGGAYLLSRYVAEQLEEVRDKVMQERAARENLRRRFEQNQEDALFTIMSLLPTLSLHILEGMDVESVTYELQSHSRASKAIQETQEPEPSAKLPSESTKEEQDNRSDNGSVSVVSAANESSAPSELANSASSWAHQVTSVHSSQLSGASSWSSGSAHPDSPKSNIGSNDLSDSIMTSSSAMSYAEAASQPEPEIAPTKVSPRSKAELWREVKMLTFTRTLTILYSLTLLSLFTHIQLNTLGRLKYIQSVIQQAEEEINRERLQESLSISSLLFGVNNPDDFGEEPEIQETEPLSEETERKYLTLTWWILHVGWKDVGERVRRGVEEVFEGVSLKAKLTAADLHRLVSDVRRRVEYEVTFEGKERRINFVSTLLPPTPETLQHVLIQGGIPPRLAASHDPTFQKLLFETRSYLSSPSMERVLEVCLDKATEMLFVGLEKHVFVEPSSVASQEQGSLPGQETRVRLAGMLPGLARWCHLALEGLPNELIDGLASVREVQAFSAIIYTNYEDRFRQ